MALTTQHPGTQQLVVVGTSFRRVGFGRMGDLVLPPDAADERRALKELLGADELIYLSTCNRVELYALVSGEVQGDELAFRVACWFADRGGVVDSHAFFGHVGADALTHLFRVCSSLDSLVVGETEIGGQLRRARDLCRQLGLCGKGLDALVEKGIAVSRRVRAETAVGDTHVSIATIALQKIRKHFGKEGPGVAALIGVGEMSRKVARTLRGTTGKRIVINRTLERALEFCAEHGGKPQSLDAFREDPPAWLDLVFTATSADGAVIGARELAPALEARKRAGVTRPLIVVDLGLPRDVHPEVDDLEGVLVISMVHMEELSRARQARLDEEKQAAEEVVREEVARHLREDHFRTLAGESADALLSTRLKHLSEQDRETLRRFVTGLAGRMARQPMDVKALERAS
ncbi:MAG: glutamyl-tRNA reductase [Planctomycetota bacterium]